MREKIEDAIVGVLRESGKPMTTYQLMVAVERRRRIRSNSIWKRATTEGGFWSELFFRPTEGTLEARLERLNQEHKLLTERSQPAFSGGITYLYHRLLLLV